MTRRETIDITYACFLAIAVVMVMITTGEAVRDTKDFSDNTESRIAFLMLFPVGAGIFSGIGGVILSCYAGWRWRVWQLPALAALVLFTLGMWVMGKYGYVAVGLLAYTLLVGRWLLLMRYRSASNEPVMTGEQQPPTVRKDVDMVTMFASLSAVVGLWGFGHFLVGKPVTGLRIMLTGVMVWVLAITLAFISGVAVITTLFVLVGFVTWVYLTTRVFRLALDLNESLERQGALIEKPSRETSHIYTASDSLRRVVADFLERLARLRS
ncbi:MAG: hypothetical protein IIB11_08500 [Chloroflexi bacterium]|nr:hypothetical protein [Chloroflexota bacterium]